MSDQLAEFRKYFPDSEIRCRCHLGEKCPAPVHLAPDFAALVLATRLWLGEPMLITSGIRCQYWNDLHGGAPHSWHLKALAVDVQSKGAAYNARLIEAAIRCGIKGIGVKGGKGGSKGIVHLDGRPATKVEIFGY